MEKNYQDVKESIVQFLKNYLKFKVWVLSEVNGKGEWKEFFDINIGLDGDMLNIYGISSLDIKLCKFDLNTQDTHLFTVYPVRDNNTSIKEIRVYR